MTRWNRCRRDPDAGRLGNALVSICPANGPAGARETALSSDCHLPHLTKYEWHRVASAPLFGEGSHLCFN
jgi:hypothetical protein